MEPDKCDDLKWAPFDEIPENMTLHVRKAIVAMREGVFFEEISLEELKSRGLYLLNKSE